MHTKSPQSCPTLCDTMEYSLPGSSIHGILQARILEWVAMYFSRESSQPRYQTHVSYVSCIGRWALLTLVPSRKPLKSVAAAAKSLHSCPTLCDPIDGCPPGFPLPGILRQEYWSGLSFPIKTFVHLTAMILPFWKNL